MSTATPHLSVTLVKSRQISIL